VSYITVKGVIAIEHQNRCPGCMEEISSSKTCPHCGYQAGSEPESLLHLPPGTLLQGKFLLGRVLGQGGFGITYLAWDTILNIKLAIKEYLPQQMATRSAGQNTVTVYKSSLAAEFRYGRDKFLEEARTLARFNERPNIVTVRDYFEANGTAYLVMNYHEGITLQNYFVSKGGVIPVDQALSIFMPVLDALKEVHNAGILHRDISPDNLLIEKTGRVVLIDFGAARQAMGEKSKSLSVIMKAGYSPPEQYQSRGKQGTWTDIYSVAASFYRAITGQAPLEAIDRMTEDDLLAPSKLGIAIEPKQEEALLKALAVKAEERYKTVEQFQAELISVSRKNQAVKGYAGVMPEKTTGFVTADKERVEEDHQEKLKAELVEAGRMPAKKPLPDQQPVDRSSWQITPYTISRKTVKTASLVAVCGLFIFGVYSFFGGGGSREDLGRFFNVDKEYQHETEGTANLADPKQQPTYDPAVIAALDAEYYIDYENGIVPIGDLPIGTRIFDPSWGWEFRLGVSYSDVDMDGDPTPPGEVKPVTWIIVAKDHYGGLEPHVTLLSEDLIALYPFDNSTERGHQSDEYGYNNWGESGTANATRGLRPWLNSTGIHSGEGFYRVFSDSFKAAMLTTTVPNKEWKNGSAYSTQDRVFLPSTTELGDTAHFNTYQIGKAYSYFQGAGVAKRVARIGGETWWYWTSSPASSFGGGVRGVDAAGGFYYLSYAYYDYAAVRPALNLKSEVLVSENRN
jgi:serine/threonine protein kinase